MRSNNEGSGFKIEQVDGAHVLDGAFDTNCDFAPLLKKPPPLILDLRGIQAVNSVGIRRWLEFLQAWGKKDLELVGCTPPFVSMLNSVPPAAGWKPRAGCVRSVLVPYSCELCNLYMETEVALSILKQDTGNVELPDVICRSCGAEARLVADTDEYFLFFLWKPEL